MKLDKQELEKKIRDAKDLSNEDKSNLLQLLKEKKIYGLVWEDSTEDAWEMMKDNIPVLKEDETKRILHGSENANHILIEGDNLNALTALSYTHEGMIDVIYIDPPYNTGSDGFMYSDRLVGADDAFRHSKWLSFMYKRLTAAKKLLADTGVIYLSIDDHEQAPLKMLCDMVFGERNFIDVIARKTKGGSDQGTFFRPTKDYVLVYAKNVEYVSKFSDKSMAPEARNYPFIEEGTGRYYRKAHSLYQGSLDPLRGCVNQRYYIEAPDGTLVLPPGPHRPDECIEGGRITPQSREDKIWRWSRDSYLANKDKVMFARSNRSPLIDSDGNSTTWNVYEKKYQDEEVGAVDYPLPDDFTDMYLNSLATTTLNAMGIDFLFSKPYELIRHLIDITDKDKSIIVLDFFAGSGTTLHATMQLNAEDGGHRQCILVTNNENGICKNVTYERNKRVIEGYTTPKGDKVEGLKDNNLRYYKIDFKERKQSHQSNRELFHEMKDLLCIKEDIYQEQHQFGSLPLKGKERMIRYFAENGREMLMVYDTRVIPFIVKEIEKMSEKEQPLKIYIFADGAYPYTDDFATVIDKVSLVPMPYAYYRGIKDSLPDVEPKKEDNTELTDEEQKQMMAEAIEAENNEKKED